VILVGVILTAAGLSASAIFLRLGDPIRRRVQRSIAVFAVAALAIASVSLVSASWDASESRRNSFSEREVAALRSINGDLHIVAHFAPEDPRRADLEHNAFRKLRRALPRTRITYVSATSTGLFEQTRDKYGEIEYALGSQSASSRSITTDGVLESVFTLAGLTPPAESEDDVFRGHPLAARPRGAAIIFYGAWPLMVAVLAVMVQRGKA
jgi:hypothetical protein